MKLMNYLNLTPLKFIGFPFLRYLRRWSYEVKTLVIAEFFIIVTLRFNSRFSGVFRTMSNHI